jgi:hypothetical protein
MARLPGFISRQLPTQVMQMIGRFTSKAEGGEPNPATSNKFSPISDIKWFQPGAMIKWIAGQEVSV